MVEETDKKIRAAGETVAGGEAMPPAPSTRDGGNPGNGAPPSNTAPLNYIPEAPQSQILRYAVDSLYVSYPGSLTENFEQQLELLKLRAQSKEIADSSEANIVLVDHQFEVLGKGKGFFPYVLVDNWYHISLSRSDAEKLPMGYVQISSELLTRAGVGASVQSLTNIMSILRGARVQPSISRVDLCVDFTTEYDLSEFCDSGWVTRAKQYARYYDGQHFSGFTFGLGGDISCRLYNKTLELKKSKKEYLKPLWKEAGWDGVSNVWRLEFEFKRNALKGVNVNRLSDLQLWMNSIWYYAVTEWIQLKIQTDDKNSSRWPVHPFWMVFLNPSFNSHPVEPIVRVSKTRVPDDDYLFVHGLAPITSYMAKRGIENFDQAIDAFGKEARDFHRRRSQISGKTLTTYVKEKVKDKRKRYNVKERVDVKQAAAQYRQARGKE